MLNWAGLLSLLCVVGCALAAGLSASSENIGWFWVQFAASGLAVGFNFAVLIQKVAYTFLDMNPGKQLAEWLCMMG